MSNISNLQILLAKAKAAKLAKLAEANKISEVEFPKGIVIASDPVEVQEEKKIEFLQNVEENLEDREAEKASLQTSQTSQSFHPASHAILGVARDDLILNSLQQKFCETVLTGQDVILVGSAGTGKTTSVRQTSKELLKLDIPKISDPTRWLKTGLPGIVVLSYTRKAVNNIRHAVIDELKPHVITIHKLLEFSPTFYEIEDPKRPGFLKKTMKFEPQRNSLNPLPSRLSVLLFEESSMIGIELYSQLQQALPHKHQEIFLGDIQQLPPVFGASILGFKMLELPIIELVEIYRQAKESPIISLACSLLEGKSLPFSSATEKYREQHPVTGKMLDRIRVPSLQKFEGDKFNSDGVFQGRVTFQPFQKKLSEDHALSGISHTFEHWFKTGYYNPAEDVILVPFNKALGTVELGKKISNFLGKERGAKVFEVIAGYNKHYLAVGDRVLYDKEDAEIIDIALNSEYLGEAPIHPSVHLDRWGTLHEVDLAEQDAEASKRDSILSAQLDGIEDFALEIEDLKEIENRVNAASHVVIVRMTATDEIFELDTAKEINDLLNGYAITIHKFQGSEAEKVFLILHHSHSMMVSRELLYTAVTRAKKFLHIICEKDSFERGVKLQRIKGNSLREKALEFQGKLSKGTNKDEIRNQVAKLGSDLPFNPWQRKVDAEPEARSNIPETELPDLENGVGRENSLERVEEEKLPEKLPETISPVELKRQAFLAKLRGMRK